MFCVICGSIFLAVGQTALSGTWADVHPAKFIPIQHRPSYGRSAEAARAGPRRAPPRSDDASYVTGALLFVDGGVAAL